MKALFYSLVFAGSLLVAASPASASVANDGPTTSASPSKTRVAAASKEATAKRSVKMRTVKVTKKLRHAMLVAIGMEDSKSVTSPRVRSRRLHAHQEHLKSHALHTAGVNRRHWQR